MTDYYTNRRAVLLKRRGWRRKLRVPRSPFLLRKWFALHVGSVGFSERRTWFNRRRAERREFKVYYGFNPRCLWKGSYGRPGTFHWRRAGVSEGRGLRRKGG